MAKIKIKFGAAEFSGNGEPEWLAEMADRFIEKLDETSAELFAQDNTPSNEGITPNPKQQVSSLKKHLEDRNGLKSQNDKFLATADWLLKRGVKQVSTADVTKALRDNQQSRVGNPSDCLNQNVSKGYCEKSGKVFFITPEGYAHLGDS